MGNGKLHVLDIAAPGTFALTKLTRNSKKFQEKVERNLLVSGGNSNILYVHPYLGKISNLTNIFEMGWHHQLVYIAGTSTQLLKDMNCISHTNWNRINSQV